MRNKALYNKLIYRLLPLVTIVLMIALWAIAAWLDGTELVFPKLSTTLKDLYGAVTQAEFWKSVGNTALRAVLSFCIAFVAAIALSLLAVKHKPFAAMFYPVVVLLRALPTISIIFICYLSVKSWYRAVLISFLVIFPTLYSSFYTAFKQTEGPLAEVGVVYGVKRRYVLTKYVIPSVWEYVFSDIVSILSLTVKLVVAAEAITATRNSLGGLMHRGQVNLDMGLLFAYTVVAILLAYAMELVVRLTAKIVKGASLKCRLH